MARRDRRRSRSTTASSSLRRVVREPPRIHPGSDFARRGIRSSTKLLVERLSGASRGASSRMAADDSSPGAEPRSSPSPDTSGAGPHGSLGRVRTASRARRAVPLSARRKSERFRRIREQRYRSRVESRGDAAPDSRNLRSSRRGRTPTATARLGRSGGVSDSRRGRRFRHGTAPGPPSMDRRSPRRERGTSWRTRNPKTGAVPDGRDGWADAVTREPGSRARRIPWDRGPRRRRGPCGRARRSPS